MVGADFSLSNFEFFFNRKYRSLCCGCLIKSEKEKQWNVISVQNLPIDKFFKELSEF